MRVRLTHDPTPAALSRLTLPASASETLLWSSTGELAVLGMPTTSNRSLTAMGIPCSVPRTDAGAEFPVQLLGQQLQFGRGCHVDKGIERRLLAVDYGEHLVQ